MSIAPSATPATESPAQTSIVSDPRTGLEWSGTLATRMTHDQAVAACSDLRLGGHDDWRLPTANELAALVDYSRHSPAIDTALFPDTHTSWYWTASPVASYPDCAWIVSFYNGYVGGNPRGNLAWVRAVRGPRASQ